MSFISLLVNQKKNLKVLNLTLVISPETVNDGAFGLIYVSLFLTKNLRVPGIFIHQQRVSLNTPFNPKLSSLPFGLQTLQGARGTLGDWWWSHRCTVVGNRGGRVLGFFWQILLRGGTWGCMKIKGGSCFIAFLCGSFSKIFIRGT